MIEQDACARLMPYDCHIDCDQGPALTRGETGPCRELKWDRHNPHPATGLRGGRDAATLEHCRVNTASRPGIATRVLLTLITLLCLQCARATLLFHDGFSYPVGEELGDTVSSPPWANDKRPFTIVNGSLTYPGLQAPTGNRVNAAGTAPSLDSVRTLDGSWKRQSSGTLYVSFILRLHSSTEIGSTGAGTSLVTLSDTANNTQLLGINLLNDGATRLGVLKYPSGSASVSSSAFFTSGPGAELSADGSTTYLIVARYQWVEGTNNDEVTLWVNPATLGGAEDPTNKVFTSAGLDGTNGIGRLTFSRGPNVNLDEVRIGQTWAEVTPTDGSSMQLMVLISALACGLVGAGVWITHLRRKVEERSAALGAQIRERQKAEHQRIMEQERARIAHDLHDELGADITEVSMLATRAQSDSGAPGEGRRCLEQVAEKTRQLVATLDEIVWAMNPQHDSLGALVNYFSFWADRFLGLANIRLTVDASEDALDLAIDARVRHQLFLVFKEALTNVVRHSGANEVRLVIRVENRALHVLVADNGCGLREPVPATGAHEGIANMRRRLEKLGGHFEMPADTDRGTTVKFSVPSDS